LRSSALKTSQPGLQALACSHRGRQSCCCKVKRNSSAIAFTFAGLLVKLETRNRRGRKLADIRPRYFQLRFCKVFLRCGYSTMHISPDLCEFSESTSYLTAAAKTRRLGNCVAPSYYFSKMYFKFRSSRILRLRLWYLVMRQQFTYW